MHIFWARLASFGHLGLISDRLIVSKFHNETHDPKGQENNIYTIVKGYAPLSSTTEDFHLNVNPHKPCVLSVSIGKQCRPRSDAVERGVWSGYLLFAYGMLLKNAMSIASFLCGYRQTVQTQIIRRRKRCLIRVPTICSIKIWKNAKENTPPQQPLKWKWTGPIYKGKKVHSA